MAKTHMMPYFYMSLCAKEPYNLWLFCDNELQLKASYKSLPTCTFGYDVFFLVTNTRFDILV